MNDDADLLRHYVNTRSEEAFTELVRRHLGFVYHAALRQLAGDDHQAQEAAQVVFTEFARKAPALANRPVILAGWLHTATRHAAARIRRSEHRRRVRETTAFMNPAESDPAASADWARLRPVIDDALYALSAVDREAVLLRFFEGQAYAEIGSRLAITEDGARRRVERALDKLRRQLSRRGVASTASALGLALGTQAGLAPPAGLAASVGAAALAGLAAGGAAGNGLLAGLSLKTTLAVTGALIVALGVGYTLTRPPALPAPTAIVPAPPSVPASPLTAAGLLGSDYLVRLRGASAADFGRLLVELWRRGTPAARMRFREVFDHWLIRDPEAASRWAVVTRTTDIGGKDGPALREKSALAWAERDFDAAYVWTLTQPDEASFQGLVSVLLRHLAKTDPAAALEFSRLGTPEMRRSVLPDIFGAWARSAPLSALAALENDPKIEEPGYIANRIHLVWAETDPTAATRHLLSTATGLAQKDRDNTTGWYMSLEDKKISANAVAQATLDWWNDQAAERPLNDFPAWGMAYALQHWCRTEPERVLAFVQALQPDRLRELVLARIAGTANIVESGDKRHLAYEPVIGLALLSLTADEEMRARRKAQFVQNWAQVDPEAALAWARAQPDDKLSASIQAGAYRAIAAQEPETAIAAWKNLPASDAREGLAMALAEGWAEKDPATAVAWFSKEYPTPAYDGSGMQTLFILWMKKDPDAATVWAEKNGRRGVRDAAACGTQVILLPEGLAYTVRLAPDTESLRRWLSDRAVWWLEKDRAAATKFLTETPLLTPEDKTYLLGLKPGIW